MSNYHSFLPCVIVTCIYHWFWLLRKKITFRVLLNGKSILIYAMKTILIGFPSGYVVDKTLNFCNEFDLFDARLSIWSSDYNFKVYHKPIKKIPISQFRRFMAVYCSLFPSFIWNSASKLNAEQLWLFSCFFLVGGVATRKMLIPIPHCALWVGMFLFFFLLFPFDDGNYPN